MTILICGVRSEPPVQLLIDALTEKKADFFILNQPDMVEYVRLRWLLSDKGISGAIQIDDNVVDLRDISGVFHRFMSVDHMECAAHNITHQRRTRSLVTGLMDLFDILPARIVNSRRAMLTNVSKPFQSLIIRQAGFLVPETMITNIADRARNFIEEQGEVIFKSISSVRSIVEKTEGNRSGRLESVRLLPTQFQRKINGDNIRVHVVGEQTFASRIKTSATDYRYAPLENETISIEPYELDESIKNRCIILTQQLDLLFAGIDLIVTDDKVFCLEVNTSPAYSFYQQRTQQPIAQSLAELLIGDFQKERNQKRPRIKPAIA